MLSHLVLNIQYLIFLNLCTTLHPSPSLSSRVVPPLFLQVCLNHSSPCRRRCRHYHHNHSPCPSHHSLSLSLPSKLYSRLTVIHREAPRSAPPAYRLVSIDWLQSCSCRHQRVAIHSLPCSSPSLCALISTTFSFLDHPSELHLSRCLMRAGCQGSMV